MEMLTTAVVGQRVRLRVGRRWVEGTVLHVGTDFGGTPTARVDVPDRWRDYRHEAIHKLRPAVEVAR